MHMQSTCITNSEQPPLHLPRKRPGLKSLIYDRTISILRCIQVSLSLSPSHWHTLWMVGMWISYSFVIGFISNRLPFSLNTSPLPKTIAKRFLCKKKKMCREYHNANALQVSEYNLLDCPIIWCGFVSTVITTLLQEQQQRHQQR